MQKVYHGILPPLRYFPLVSYQLDHPVERPERGWVMISPEVEEFNREFIWSHCRRVCHRHQGPGSIVFCRFDADSVCDRPLGKPFDNFESELVRVCVEKGAEELRPLSEDKAWFSKHPALFITELLRANFSRVLYVQGHEALEEPPLIALTQIILHTLDVSFNEPYVGIVADRVDVRVFSPDSSLQLAVLLVSLCRFQTARLPAIAVLISASAWASPVHLRRCRLRVRGGATRFAVFSMTAIKAVSTSSLSLLLGTDGGHSSVVAGR